MYWLRNKKINFQIHTLVWRPVNPILRIQVVIIFHAFVVCCLLTFFKTNFFKKNMIRVSNGLNTDQDRNSDSPDLGPNYLQRLSADNKSYR